MVSKEEITIVISPEGETEVSVKGVKGKNCQTLTAALEAALGAVISDTPTEEMNQREVRNNAEQHHHRA